MTTRAAFLKTRYGAYLFAEARVKSVYEFTAWATYTGALKVSLNVSRARKEIAAAAMIMKAGL